MNLTTVNDIAALVRQTRRKRGWTQARLAEQAGVGREWIVSLEKAKPTLELVLVLRTLKALNLTLSLNPQSELPEDAIDLKALF